MTEQHYRITLDEALAQYEIGLITATALVYFYIRIKRAEGWKITLYQEQVCEELKIDRSTFYKAVAKLIKKGLLDPDKRNGITVEVLPISQNDTSDTISKKFSLQFGDSNLQTVDSNLQTVDSNLQTVDSSLQTVESQEPETPKNLGSGVSTDIYQIFYNSLSKEERESFLEFGNKLASQLPTVPTLPSKWIAANFEDIRAQWEKSRDVSSVPKAQNTRFDKHPQRKEWIEECYERGLGWVMDVPKNSPEREERDAFYDYMRDNNLMGYEQ